MKLPQLLAGLGELDRLIGEPEMLEEFTCCRCGCAEEFSGNDWADCVWYAINDGWSVEESKPICPACCEEEVDE